MNTINESHNVMSDLDSMDRIIKFSEIMATGKCTIPKDFQNNPGDCLAIALQAQLWGMNPYTLAQKSFIIKGKIGYEAQLINAVITKHAPIIGRPEFKYSDGWDRVQGKFKMIAGSNGSYASATYTPEDEKGLWCEVSATMRGENQPRVLHLDMIQAQPRQSTQWATDPKQQLSYTCLKKWARLHCSDIILGVYSLDDIESMTSAEKEKDITPESNDQENRIKSILNQELIDPDFALEIIENCSTVDDLEDAGRSFKNNIDSQYSDKIKTAYKEKMAAILK